MEAEVQKILEEIDQVLGEWDAFRAGSRHEDCSDKPEFEAVAITNRMASTVHRLAPPGSIHLKKLDTILASQGHEYSSHVALAGTLKGLRREYELGLFHSVSELIHAEFFSDFLEMASHLLGNGYKDAAAVIVGSVLEQHLRKLCAKNGIASENNNKPKKADTLNSELAAQSIYSKLDQKNVTAWLGLRNDAAHGNYSNYTKDQAQLMLDGVLNFLARHSA